MGRFARRFGERQGHDPLGHLRAEGLNARGPGLVAQQAIDAFVGKPFLPAPDNRLALGGASHDRHRAEPLGSGQHDPGAPDVLLRAIAVRHDGFEPVTLSGGYFDDDPGAHRTNSHVESAKGIHLRTRPSRSIH